MMALSPEAAEELRRIAVEGGKDAVYANALLCAAGEDGENGQNDGHSE